MSSQIIITINRDFGADGHEIGAQLAHRLNIPLYDKDILGKAALKKGKDESSLRVADESLTKENINPFFPSLNFTRKSDQLFEIERDIIRDLAEVESCIIVGRLSDYILRDKENLLNVFITAPFKFRASSIQEKYNCSQSDSKKLVRRMDIVRRDFKNYYSNGKYKLYENKSMIVLNRAIFGIDGCVEILEATYNLRLKQLMRD